MLVMGTDAERVASDFSLDGRVENGLPVKYPEPDLLKKATVDSIEYAEVMMEMYPHRNQGTYDKSPQYNH